MLEPPDLRIPDGVPLGVALLVDDRLVTNRARWVRLEVVAIATVEKSVEHHHDVVASADVAAIAPPVQAGNALRVTIEATGRDVDRLVVKEHPDLGLLRGRLTLVRLLLDEPACRRMSRVQLVIQPAVQRWWGVDPHGVQRPFRSGCALGRLGGQRILRGGAKDQHDREREAWAARPSVISADEWRGNRRGAGQCRSGRVSAVRQGDVWARMAHNRNLSL